MSRNRPLADAINAGFTRSTNPCRPVVDAPRWGPSAINVGGQRREDGSLLNWMERLIRRRRECPEIGWGRMRLLDVHDPAVLAHRCDWDGNSILAIHSFAAGPTNIEVSIEDMEAAVDLFADDELRPNERGSLTLKLDGYDHRWYRLRRPGSPLPP
jgi:hypothetical protein